MNEISKEAPGAAGEVTQGKAVGIDPKSDTWTPATGKVCHQCGKRVPGGTMMYWVGVKREDGKEVNALCCKECSVAHMNGTQRVTIEGRRAKNV